MIRVWIVEPLNVICMVEPMCVYIRGSRTRVLASARVCACAIVVFAHSYSSIAPCNSDGKGREG